MNDTRPCPACPDGNEWTSEGPTCRCCKVCGGHAVVNLDGSRISEPDTHDFRDQGNDDKRDPGSASDWPNKPEVLKHGG